MKINTPNKYYHKRGVISVMIILIALTSSITFGMDQDEYEQEYRKLKKFFSSQNQNEWKGIKSSLKSLDKSSSKEIEKLDSKIEEIKESIEDLESRIKEYKADSKEAIQEVEEEYDDEKRRVKKSGGGSSHKNKNFKANAAEYNSEYDISKIKFPYKDSSFGKDTTKQEKASWVKAMKLLKEVSVKKEKADWAFSQGAKAQSSPIGRAKAASSVLKGNELLLAVMRQRVQAATLKDEVRMSVTMRRKGKIIQGIQDEIDAVKEDRDEQISDANSKKDRLLGFAELKRDRVPLDTQFTLTDWSQVTSNMPAELLYELKRKGIEHVYFVGIFSHDSGSYVVADALSSDLSKAFNKQAAGFSNKVLYPSPELSMDIKMLDGKPTIESNNIFRKNSAILIGEMIKLSKFLCVNVRAVDLSNLSVIKSKAYMLAVDKKLKGLLDDSALAGMKVSSKSDIAFKLDLIDVNNYIGQQLLGVEGKMFTAIDRHAGVPSDKRFLSFILLKHMIAEKTDFEILDSDFLVKVLPLGPGVTEAMLNKAYPVSLKWIVSPEDGKVKILCYNEKEQKEVDIGVLTLKLKD